MKKSNFNMCKGILGQYFLRKQIWPVFQKTQASSIVVESKKILSKKHSFVYRELQFTKKTKIGAKKILTLVCL